MGAPLDDVDSPAGGLAPSPDTEAQGRARSIPRQARSRRTRERILLAAVACFERKGLDDTTTGEIAAEAGIAVGTLYGHFANKRDILLELLDHSFYRMTDQVIACLDPERWPPGRERAQVASLIASVFDTRACNPGVQRILWERYYRDPEFRQVVQAIESRIRSALVRLLRVLHEQGRLRVDDLDTAAFLVFTTAEWTATRLVLGEYAGDPESAVAVATDMICRFLFP